MVAGSRPANGVGKDGGPSGRRRGAEVPRKPGNAVGQATVRAYAWAVALHTVEGRALASGVLGKEDRIGDWR